MQEAVLSISVRNGQGVNLSPKIGMHDRVGLCLISHESCFFKVVPEAIVKF
jgi:hypothetical protein